MASSYNLTRDFIWKNKVLKVYKVSAYSFIVFTSYISVGLKGTLYFCKGYFMRGAEQLPLSITWDTTIDFLLTCHLFSDGVLLTD